MKKLILFLAISIQFIANAQQWDWAVKGTAKSNQYAKDICIDKQGNTFIIGYNSSTSYFGNTPTDTVSAGCFFTKFNTTGGFLWSINLWGEPTDIKTDDLGNIYVIGTFTAPIITSSNTFTPSGEQDFYVSKFDSYGNEVWVKAYGGPGYDKINGISIDNNQNILVTGLFRDSIMLDGYKLKHDLSWNPDTYWTAKLKPTGIVQWANKGPSTFECSEGRGVCTDKHNNVYVVGSRMIPNCQMYCMSYFMVKYGSDGAIKVTKSNWGFYEAPQLVTVDDSCNVYTMYNGGSHYTWSPVLEKNDSLINGKWATYLGNGYGGYIHYKGLSIDSLGNIYLAGAVGGVYKKDSVQIGSNWVKTRGETDILISKLNNAGQFIWSKSVEGSSTECNPNLYGAFPGELCVDRTGNCFLVADFNYQGSNLNGDTMYLNKDTLINDGNWEQLFVAKLRTTNPTISIGIQEIVSENIFNIYPNPNSGAFTIMSNENTELKVCIYDLNGRCVYTKTTVESVTSVDLSKQAKGLYFIEASTNDKVQRRKLLVE